MEANALVLLRGLLFVKQETIIEGLLLGIGHCPCEEVDALGGRQLIDDE